MSIESVYQCLYGRFVDMAYIGRSLPGFAASYYRLLIDESECINNHFPFDGLDGIDDDSNGTRLKGFEGLKPAISIGCRGVKVD